MCKQIFCSALALFLLASCAKNAAEPVTETEILIEADVAPPEDEFGDEDEGGGDLEGKKYYEIACSVGNKLGTACEAGQGSCKKKRACSAGAALAYARLSEEQMENIAVDHAMQMVREGYIDAKDMESSKRVYQSALKAQKN